MIILRLNMIITEPKIIRIFSQIITFIDLIIKSQNFMYTHNYYIDIMKRVITHIFIIIITT